MNDDDIVKSNWPTCSHSALAKTQDQRAIWEYIDAFGRTISASVTKTLVNISKELSLRAQTASAGRDQEEVVKRVGDLHVHVMLGPLLKSGSRVIFF